MKNSRILIFSLLTIALALMAVAGVVSATSVQAAPQGDSYILQQYPVKAVFVSTSYTSSQTANSKALETGSGGSVYGSLQVQAIVDVTSTQVTTITPQFSNELGACTAAANWTDAAQPVVVFNSYTTPTAATQYVMSLKYTLTGDGTDNRELSAGGRCFRVSIVSAAPVYTPTVYIRLLKRN